MKKEFISTKIRVGKIYLKDIILELIIVLFLFRSVICNLNKDKKRNLINNIYEINYLMRSNYLKLNNVVIRFFIRFNKWSTL